ncbi:TIGR04086 family membrane protein [Dehalobacter sp. DCM]|uniref:TIGR04086 family membrane protein n=1 Tax=Dehalobacter sp. DCM TaxID=2907827 RepID=UPI003081A606|nr:TIGR04086 family membrane protein [Dehalobacter sp. DCM]
MPKSFQLSLVAKGIVMAIVISFLLTIILSLLYFFTSLQESMLYSLLAAGIGVLAASIYISYQAGTKGIIYGLAIGIGFFLISIIIYYIFYTGEPSWKIILEKVLVTPIAGAVGGTVGAISRR